MSYKPYEAEGRDNLSVLFSRMVDCFTFCRKMMKVRNVPEDFILWFEKAKLADPRTTYLFIKSYYDVLANSAVKSIVDDFIERIENTRHELK